MSTRCHEGASVIRTQSGKRVIVNTRKATVTDPGVATMDERGDRKECLRQQVRQETASFTPSNAGWTTAGCRVCRRCFTFRGE